MAATNMKKNVKVRRFNPIEGKNGRTVQVQLEGFMSFQVDAEDDLLRKIKPGYSIDFEYGHAQEITDGTTSGGATQTYINLFDVEVTDARPSVSSEKLKHLPDVENNLVYKPSKAVLAEQKKALLGADDDDIDV